MLISIHPLAETLWELERVILRSVDAPTKFDIELRVTLRLSGAVVNLNAVGPEFSIWVPSDLKLVTTVKNELTYLGKMILFIVNITR